MQKLSVLVPTYNCEKVVRDCLESVQWADEIVVVDSLSTDGTLEVCREYTDRVLQREFVRHARQKNWAIPHCAHGWVLQLDSDERAEAGLKDEILGLLAMPPDGVDGFRIPRKNHVLGVWIKAAGLYPDYQTRLFRKNLGRFEDREVHEHLRLPGEVGALEHHIVHYGMPNISKQLANLDRYTRYEANELRKRGRRFRWYQLALRPLAIFAYRYFWKRGFSAGYRGFILAAYLAIYDFLAHAKLWEMEELGLDQSP